MKEMNLVLKLVNLEQFPEFDFVFITLYYFYFKNTWK